MQPQTITSKPLWTLTGEFFGAIYQLRSLNEANQPEPEVLHRGFRRAIDRFVTQAPVHGIDIQDVQDIQYALVALADEAALSLGGRVRDHWLQNMLQVFYFRENVAGDGFYDRLSLVRQRRRQVAMEAYYLALLHGFRGRYGMHGKELELHDLIEDLGSELKRLDAAQPRVLSPDGERPTESIVQGRTHRGLVYYALGALALSLAIYFGMRIDLRVRVANFADQLQEAY
jgi:type VI secretion system protein ImpK